MLHFQAPGTELGSWSVLEIICCVKLNFPVGGKDERELHAKHSEFKGWRNMAEMVGLLWEATCRAILQLWPLEKQKQGL